jgi:hypothetical protein
MPKQEKANTKIKTKSKSTVKKTKTKTAKVKPMKVNTVKTTKTKTVRKVSTKKTTYSKEEVAKKFIQMLNTVKLYHWKTHSYSTHKATDDLYGNLNDGIDKFMEILLGKNGSRIDLKPSENISLKAFSNATDFKKEIESYKSYLINMKGLNITSNNDLLNVRDEILGNLNQFTYLLTFNK